jgi:hypothetical protein
MKLLSLFVIALLVVLFPKQGLKAIGLCLGVCAMLVCVVWLWLYSMQLNTERANKRYWATIHAEEAAKEEAQPAWVAYGFDPDPVKAMAQLQASNEEAKKKVEELNKRRDEERRFEEDARAQTGFLFSEPLYVNPKLMPTPPPVSKPTPRSTPVPAKPETLYTSK